MRELLVAIALLMSACFDEEAPTTSTGPVSSGNPGSGATASGGCCKHCTNSKPCGDSCIALNSTCHAGSGCACLAPDELEPDLVAEMTTEGSSTTR